MWFRYLKYRTDSILSSLRVKICHGVDGDGIKYGVEQFSGMSFSLLCQCIEAKNLHKQAGKVVDNMEPKNGDKIEVMEVKTAYTFLFILLDGTVLVTMGRKIIMHQIWENLKLTYAKASIVNQILI